jgi:hypothetical protein
VLLSPAPRWRWPGPPAPAAQAAAPSAAACALPAAARATRARASRAAAGALPLLLPGPRTPMPLLTERLALLLLLLLWLLLWLLLLWLLEEARCPCCQRCCCCCWGKPQRRHRGQPGARAGPRPRHWNHLRLGSSGCCSTFGLLTCRSRSWPAPAPFGNETGSGTRAGVEEHRRVAAAAAGEPRQGAISARCPSSLTPAAPAR